MARHDRATARALPTTDAELAAALDAAAGSADAAREHVLSVRRAARAALDARLARVLLERGYDATAACARELGAALSDVSVGELLQTIALGRKDAVLDVFDGALVGRVWCSAGEIIDATSGRLKGESAAFRVLANEHGELSVDFRAVRRARTIHTSTQALMLEAARRKDEYSLLEARLGGARGAYVATAGAASVSPDGVDAQLLAAFAGGARVEAVRAGSTLDDLVLLQSIGSLIERGLLVSSHGPRSRETPIRGTPPLGAPSAQAPRRPAFTAASRSTRLTPTFALPLPVRHPRLRPSARALAGWLAFAACALSLAGLLLDRDEPEIPVYTTRAADPAPDGSMPPPETAQQSLMPAPMVMPPGEASSGEASSGDASYSAHVVVDPAEASLWLDGARVASGELSI
ncbi:MAG TPA: DUF4388 domain-containing protein, partial [Polyangiaceae bacterium]|nr:DUF4388 domain-containing protein [Polyangiaceae bacterium]